MSEETKRTVTADDLDDLFKRLDASIEENSIDPDEVRGVRTAHDIRSDRISPELRGDLTMIERLSRMSDEEVEQELRRMDGRRSPLRLEDAPEPTPAADRLNDYIASNPPPESLQHRFTADHWAYERLPQSMQSIIDRIRSGEVPSESELCWSFETAEPTFELRLVAFVHYLQYHVIPHLSQSHLPRGEFKRHIWLTIRCYMWRLTLTMGYLDI